MGIAMTADRASQQPASAVGLVRPHGAHVPSRGGLRGRFTLTHVNYTLVATLIAVALVVPVVVFGGFTYVTVTSDLAARAATERVGSAQLAANLVDEVLLGTGEALRQVTTRPALRDAFRRRDAAALADHLADLRPLDSTTIASAAAFDPRGMMLQRDPVAPEFVGQSFADRPYMRGVLTSPSWSVSDAYVARLPVGVPLASVTMPVRDGSEVVGVLSVALDPAHVVSALRPIAGVAGREIIIVDSLRQVVASTDPSRGLASVAPLSAIDLSPTRRSGTVAAPVSGVDRLLAYAPVEDSPWTLYIVDDPAVVLAPQRSLATQLGYAGGAAAVLALIIGTFFGLFYRALSIANRRALETTARQAFTDGLTGLYNRHFMAEQLGLLHGAATRGRRTYSVVAFDADGLKGVNDAYGHETGDLALRRLAEVVRRNIRLADIPVRTGGDEFVVILPDTDLAGALRAAEHIVAAAESERTASPFGALGVSAGVAEWREGRTAEEVLRLADLLLMQAKRAGRGRAFSRADPAFASA